MSGWWDVSEAFLGVESSQRKSLQIEDAGESCVLHEDCVIRQDESSHEFQSLCRLEWAPVPKGSLSWIWGGREAVIHTYLWNPWLLHAKVLKQRGAQPLKESPKSCRQSYREYPQQFSCWILTLTQYQNESLSRKHNRNIISHYYWKLKQEKGCGHGQVGIHHWINHFLPLDFRFSFVQWRGWDHRYILAPIWEW